MNKLHGISLMLTTAMVSIGLITAVDHVSEPTQVEAAITLKGGKWASSTITYSINPGTESTIANAWVKAANEISSYKVVKFVKTNNGSAQVKLGQKITTDKYELGVTSAWLRGTTYSRAEAYLTSNQSLKNREGRNYAQRQYATALHELGHVAGLKHDSCPSGVMYYASRSNVKTIDKEYLAALVKLYGSSSAKSTGKVTDTQLSSNDKIVNQKLGVVQVHYVPRYGINLWKDFGKNWTGRRLAHGSKWKYFKVVKVNRKSWYNLGGSQWIDGSYLRKI